jgi:Flp pilus assembly protein TadD
MMTTRRSLQLLCAAFALGVSALVPVDRIEPHPVDLVTQGRPALDARRVDEAIGLFERAVSAEPTNPAALAWLGSAQVRKAGAVPPVEARAAWEKGRALSPSAPEAPAIERELRSL